MGEVQNYIDVIEKKTNEGSIAFEDSIPKAFASIVTDVIRGSLIDDTPKGDKPNLGKLRPFPYTISGRSQNYYQRYKKGESMWLFPERPLGKNTVNVFLSPEDNEDYVYQKYYHKNTLSSMREVDSYAKRIDITVKKPTRDGHNSIKRGYRFRESRRQVKPYNKYWKLSATYDTSRTRENWVDKDIDFLRADEAKLNTKISEIDLSDRHIESIFQKELEALSETQRKLQNAHFDKRSYVTHDGFVEQRRERWDN